MELQILLRVVVSNLGRAKPAAIRRKDKDTIKLLLEAGSFNLQAPHVDCEARRGPHNISPASPRLRGQYESLRSFFDLAIVPALRRYAPDTLESLACDFEFNSAEPTPETIISHRDVCTYYSRAARRPPFDSARREPESQTWLTERPTDKLKLAIRAHPRRELSFRGSAASSAQRLVAAKQPLVMRRRHDKWLGHGPRQQPATDQAPANKLPFGALSPSPPRECGQERARKAAKRQRVGLAAAREVGIDQLDCEEKRVATPLRSVAFSTSTWFRHFFSRSSHPRSRSVVAETPIMRGRNVAIRVPLHTRLAL